MDLLKRSVTASETLVNNVFPDLQIDHCRKDEDNPGIPINMLLCVCVCVDERESSSQNALSIEEICLIVHKVKAL